MFRIRPQTALETKKEIESSYSWKEKENNIAFSKVSKLPFFSEKETKNLKSIDFK